MNPNILDPANSSSPSFPSSPSYPSSANPPSVNTPPSSLPPVNLPPGNASSNAPQSGTPQPTNPTQIPSPPTATQTPFTPPSANPASSNVSDKIPPSPYPYSDQTIAQDLTESNVIGKAVTVTDNNLSVRDKIPLMKISLLLIFIITGFSGSFLYFRFTSASPVKNTAISLPTVTISSQKPAVIATPVENSVNPFATTSASFVNPFAPTSTPSYQNPFAETTANATVDNQTYQNPFENLR